MCHVALNYDNDIITRNFIEKTYSLPDGNIITLKDEQIRPAEVLFHPSFIGSESLGIHEKLFKTIMNCTIDTRKEFYKNIVLSSGTTMMKGFNERLSKELTLIVPESIKIKVTARSERKNAVWIGGSILASLTCYKQIWITKKDYLETGKNIIHKKC